MAASAKTTWELHINVVFYSQVLGASKAHFHYRSKKAQNHIRHHLDAWHTHYKKELRKNCKDY